MPAKKLLARAWRALALTVLPIGLLIGITSTAGAATVPIGTRAVKLAALERGKPYVYGAAGPSAFDCSGLVQYVYGRLGVRLPHNAELQYRDTIHLPAFRYLGPGDLVFFHSGRYVYHVGIYAGHYMVWVAPHSGSHVKLERIWTWSVWFGRAR
jgi:cell wall-associated NlpC family hydrolase